MLMGVVVLMVRPAVFSHIKTGKRGKNMHRRFIVLTAAISVLCLIIGSSQLKAHAFTVPRIYGNDRYLTAVEIAKTGWTSSANIVLATGLDYPDALSATPLAKQLNAPILLTEKNSLRPEALTEIKNLKPANAYIVGGTGVISDVVKKSLESIGIKCTRLAGSDRYGTALNVAQYMASNFSMSSEVFLVTGINFPDASSIASIAGIRNMPILLLPKSGVPDSIKSYIKTQKITKAYVVGGSGVISDAAASSIPCANERVWGSDRYGTNSAVLNRFSGDFNFNLSYLTTGENFPDALAGSALAAATKSPVILTSIVPEKATVDIVNSNISAIKNLKALGGEAIVPYSTYNTLYPWISSISDLSGTIYQSQKFTLPQYVTANLTNGSTAQVVVSWNPSTVNTVAAGTYTFKGTVDEYGKTVTYTLNINPGNAIMGTEDPTVTADKMAAFLTARNPGILSNINPDPANPTLTVQQFCQLYLDEGAKEGVRGDIAFAQSIKETGNFKFTGMSNSQWNNYAGLGVTGAGFINGIEVDEKFTDGVTILKNTNGDWVGIKFDTPALGVRAQIQHLKGYASTQPLNNPLVDPRYSLLTHAIAPYWEGLDGRWAVPGDGYGESVMQIFQNIKSYGN